MQQQKEFTGCSKISHSLGDTVTSVVISEDRGLLAACSTNKKAVVLDAFDGRLVGEFTADGAINASAIGRGRLIVGTFSGWIRIYHITSNREEYSLQFCGGSNAINYMAIAADATRLAVGGKAPHILLYALSLTDEAVGMNALFVFPTHGSNTLSLCLDADATKLVAGGSSLPALLAGSSPRAAGACARTRARTRAHTQMSFWPLDLPQEAKARWSSCGRYRLWQRPRQPRPAARARASSARRWARLLKPRSARARPARVPPSRSRQPCSSAPPPPSTRSRSTTWA